MCTRINVSPINKVMVITRRYSSSSNLFNVKSYGAKGDGFTDDTEAAQSAIAALQAATIPGGILYFPKGSYLLNQTEEWQSLSIAAGNITIRGDGVGLSKLVQGDAAAPVISIGPDANVGGHVLIEHLGFIAAESLSDDGQDLTTSKGSLLAVSGLEDNQIPSLKLQNCIFEAGMRRCVWLKNISRAIVSDCQFEATSSDDHITAVKPTSGSWHLYIGHNVWMDEQEENVPSQIDSAFGSGGGTVVVHGAASSLDSIVYQTNASLEGASASEAVVFGPDVNGRQRWWIRNDSYDTSGGTEGVDWITNAGGVTYVSIS